MSGSTKNGSKLQQGLLSYQPNVDWLGKKIGTKEICASWTSQFEIYTKRVWSTQISLIPSDFLTILCPTLCRQSAQWDTDSLIFFHWTKQNQNIKKNKSNWAVKGLKTQRGNKENLKDLCYCRRLISLERLEIHHDKIFMVRRIFTAERSNKLNQTFTFFPLRYKHNKSSHLYSFFFFFGLL